MIRDLRIKKIEMFPNGNWKTVKEAIEELNISYSCLYMKIRLGNIKAINWRGITFVLVEDKKNNIIV